MAKLKPGYFLYNCLIILISVIGIIFVLIRNLLQHRPIAPYFRPPGPEELPQLKGKPVIWIQAVSVGETVVAKILIDELRKLLSDYGFLLTTTTPTGQAMAKKILDESIAITYFPFDLPWLIKGFFQRICPAVFILVETEIWPNAIRQAKLSGSKMAMVNGMISDHSFKGYSRIRSFLKDVFSHFDLFAMQSAESANRIGHLGAPLDRIVVTGNIKFDQDYPQFTREQLDAFLVQYGWSKEIPIFTAASTHRGEEEIILEAYLRLTEREPYYLILAPRHPERVEEIIALLEAKQLPYVRRSQTASGVKDGVKILLLDTFGELGLAYAVADVVFVGGSLVNIGGHNVLEAAFQAKPVMFGPYMHKSRPSKELLEEADAGFTVQDADDLVRTIRELTQDRNLYRKRANNARAAVLSNKGAAARTATLIADLVKKS